MDEKVSSITNIVSLVKENAELAALTTSLERQLHLAMMDHFKEIDISNPIETVYVGLQKCMDKLSIRIAELEQLPNGSGGANNSKIEGIKLLQMILQQVENALYMNKAIKFQNDQLSQLVQKLSMQKAAYEAKLEQLNVRAQNMV
jgi:hypothetical protein